MISTLNGGRAAVGQELCIHSTTREERNAIVEREQRLKEWRRSLPKRKRPVHELPGPVTIIDMRCFPC